MRDLEYGSRSKLGEGVNGKKSQINGVYWKIFSNFPINCAFNGKESPNPFTGNLVWFGR
jgi:hypothetical protein